MVRRILGVNNWNLNDSSQNEVKSRKSTHLTILCCSNLRYILIYFTLIPPVNYYYISIHVLMTLNTAFNIIVTVTGTNKDTYSYELSKFALINLHTIYSLLFVVAFNSAIYCPLIHTMCAILSHNMPYISLPSLSWIIWPHLKKW